MSKGLGQKITVKFTEDLVGDISGNEQAFKVTGQEYKYVNGPLLDKEYQIDKVERYGVVPIWKDEFNNGVFANISYNAGTGLQLEVE